MTAYVLLSLTCLGFLIDQRYGSYFILFYFCFFYLLFIIFHLIYFVYYLLSFISLLLCIIFYFIFYFILFHFFCVWSGHDGAWFFLLGRLLKINVLYMQSKYGRYITKQYSKKNSETHKKKNNIFLYLSFRANAAELEMMRCVLIMVLHRFGYIKPLVPLLAFPTEVSLTDTCTALSQSLLQISIFHKILFGLFSKHAG